jgi:hypothetical protein
VVRSITTGATEEAKRLSLQRSSATRVALPDVSQWNRTARVIVARLGDKETL